MIMNVTVSFIEGNAPEAARTEAAFQPSILPLLMTN